THLVERRGLRWKDVVPDGSRMARQHDREGGRAVGVQLPTASLQLIAQRHTVDEEHQMIAEWRVTAAERPQRRPAQCRRRQEPDEEQRDGQEGSKPVPCFPVVPPVERVTTRWFPPAASADGERRRPRTFCRE